MIISPHILRQIEGQLVSSDASFGRQPPLEITPESFQAIDVVLPRSVVAFRVVNQTVDIPLGGDPRIALPGIGVDGRAPLDVPANQGPQGPSLHIRYHPSPHLATSTENPKDWGFGGSPSPLSSQCPSVSTLVLPSSTQVGFVDLHLSLKDRRHLPQHRLTQDPERPQHPLTMKSSFLRNRSRTLAASMASQNGFPLMPRQTQRKARTPFVSTPRTTALIPTYFPRLSVSAFRTAMPSRHATIVPN